MMVAKCASSRVLAKSWECEEDMARLQSFYKESVVPGLLEKFGYKSVMEVPRITKITLNMGVGELLGTRKSLSTRCPT